ncbi:serine/threonine-protein kinase rio2-like [Ruditapes philippinarum]|uniref:serine/threonine-protein kinase rio2-like n=1 Tax=Ruditapes philippinarum TaxID=129788 RepID=UPI00295B0368|nr:serine/threonine-protein kinase rio2-like [Ruditapes philippinarum]
MRTAEKKMNIDSAMNAMEYINIDSDVPVNDIEENWEMNIMESVKDKDSDVVSVCDDDKNDDDDDDDDDENCDCVQPLLINSHQDALKWLDQLKLYCLSKDMSDLSQDLGRIEDEMERQSVKIRSSSKQSTLDAFFK